MIAYDKLYLHDSIHVVYHISFAADAPDDVALSITSYLDYTNLVHMPQGFALEVKF